MSVELKTSTSEGARAGCSFFVMLILFGMAALFFYAGDEGPGLQLFQVVAVLPALLGLLMLYNTIHSLFASRAPETTITIETASLLRGEPVEIRIHQPGPLKLSSLRLNVVSEVVTIQRVRSGKTRRHSTYPYQENHLDFGPMEIPVGETRTLSGTLTIPPHVEPTGGEPGRSVSWRLEVWGKVERGADFMRPFDIEVA